ncbi:MAG: hypothetical protein HC769_22600 [Cyanobacteria bacterium CRU_2_1]|nr:hypothetical protein [Cyanobacteria bacterium RU_5_0]NJR61374.1 hypothetical protein [Cyanobacteria bacterium CRU_2_1]
MSDSIAPSLTPQPSQYQLFCPNLPLAVYREIVAHLRQVMGVEAGLLPQRSQKFDYLQSQVGGVWIRYATDADAGSRRRVEQILAYYGDRYGDWETVMEKADRGMKDKGNS